MGSNPTRTTISPVDFNGQRSHAKYIMDNETFYSNAAVILNTTHEHLPFKYGKRTRWNNRSPGSGRFPDHGIIRVFGDKVHIALYDPMISKVCDSKEEALETLRENI